jgi:YbbR domain-containing protein
MRFVKGLFLDNFLLKVMALAIAVSLVVTKRDDRVIIVKKMVGLELKYPDDRVLISMMPPQIELTIEGPYQAIRKFEEERENTPFDPYHIQFNGSENGIYNFQRDYYSLPARLNLKAISPSSMVVTFDEKIEKRLAVSASFTGKLPEGYQLKSHTLSPDFVTAFGPKSVLDKLDNLDTRAVTLRDKTSDGVLEVALKDPPLFVEFSIDSPRVNLRVVVEELIEERVFENISLGLKGSLLNKTVKITPSSVSVTVKGPLRVIGGLKLTQLKPYVDLSKVDGDDVQVMAVGLDSPPARIKWAINPNKVSLVTSMSTQTPKREGATDGRPSPSPSPSPSLERTTPTDANPTE